MAAEDMSSQESSTQQQLQSMAAPWTVKNGSIPSRRRHIASDSILEQYQALPLRSEGEQVVVAGISVAHWNIGTSQGPIGTQGWFETMTEQMEAQCQYGDGNDAGSSGRRKLALPEMVFPAAHVVLQSSSSSPSNHDVTITWNAMSALSEWSQAHQQIPMGDGMEHRGVSVLQASAASVWKRHQKNHADDDHSNKQTINSTEFHYDWTYSTPFCGSVVGLLEDQEQEWKPLDASGMPMHLLKDQSVPILYFDQIVFMEDDLHDNGLMQYSAKLRVMPTCAYVLSRLFVRIDQVLIRVRECRFLVAFETRKLYRDISWRECTWDQLGNHGLPADLRSWTRESDGGMDTAAFGAMLAKLPTVAKLPDGLMQYAECSYDEL
eukprot:scaffold24130_cov142-Cylindrotheca_fusiformis.AAC.6